MTALRRRGPVLGLLLVAGLVALLVSAQPWFTASGSAADAVGGGTITFSGAEASGGLSQALAAVVLAGVLLTLVLGAGGRRVLAVLLAGCGVGMVVLGVLRSPPSAAAVRTRFRQVSLTDTFVLDATGWPWLYAVAGLLAVAGAALLFLGAPYWTRRTRRFERTAPAPVATDPDADPAGAWRALDAGLDPTADPSADPASDPTGSDPDVHRDGSPATMESGQEQSKRRQIGDS